jgi:hypothetical protein
MAQRITDQPRGAGAPGLGTVGVWLVAPMIKWLKRWLTELLDSPISVSFRKEKPMSIYLVNVIVNEETTIQPAFTRKTIITDEVKVEADDVRIVRGILVFYDADDDIIKAFALGTWTSFELE